MAILTRLARAVRVAELSTGVELAALDEGWSQRQVSRRLASGTWRRVLGRGLTGSSGPIGVEQLAWAGWLTRPDAVVSHGTAGLLRGWPVPGAPQPVHLTGRRIIARADVLFHEARVIIEVDGFEAHSGRERFIADRRWLR